MSHGSVAAIIAAAGTGSRFSSDGRPKQFFELGGYPIYIWSLLSLSTMDDIGLVVLVSRESLLEEMKETVDSVFAERGLAASRKKIQLVPGGDTRQESVRLGLASLAAAPPEFVLVHDAARPFLTHALVQAVIEEVTATGACTLALKVADTIKKVESGAIIETLDRSNLWAAHTPQAGRYLWLREAHEKAASSGLTATDDAMLLEGTGKRVTIVESRAHNLKITVPEDIDRAASFADILGQINDYA
ncbi:MAG: 2-C-methyl-D-erythritol 4-phosphate cytidylyltransferase [Candidatus Obscuribacterales bacterium]